LNVEMLRN